MAPFIFRKIRHFLQEITSEQQAGAALWFFANAQQRKDNLPIALFTPAYEPDEQPRAIDTALDIAEITYASCRALQSPAALFPSGISKSAVGSPHSRHAAHLSHWAFADWMAEVAKKPYFLHENA